MKSLIAIATCLSLAIVSAIAFATHDTGDPGFYLTHEIEFNEPLLNGFSNFADVAIEPAHNAYTAAASPSCTTCPPRVIPSVESMSQVALTYPGPFEVGWRVLS